jgi:hypothetical protein
MTRPDDYNERNPPWLLCWLLTAGMRLRVWWRRR